MSDNAVHGVADATKTRPVRYLVFNSSHTSQLWRQLTLCGSNAAVESQEPHEDVPTKLEDEPSEELQCRTCAATFEGREEQRRHFRDDWHRYNIKQKLRDRPVIGADEFDRLQGAGDDDGISSISGSGSSDDEEDGGRPQGRGPGNPKIAFENADGLRMAVYRCLLHPKKKAPETDEEMLRLIERLPSQRHWAVLMLGGGHFAAAIYKDGELSRHKTFHSYTVRAKQGGGQSSRDNKSGGGSHPKSAGASLRRYNEAAFAEHVQGTLESWRSELDQCQLLFYRAASSNQTILFGGKNPPLERADGRLRSIPFPTRRATLKEVQRVCQCLATVEIIVDQADDDVQEGLEQLTIAEASCSSSSESEIDELNLKLPRRGRKKAKSRDAVPDVSNIPVLPLLPSEEQLLEATLEAVAGGSAADVEFHVDAVRRQVDAYRDELPLDVADVLNRRLDADCKTLLHQAALRGKADIIWKLLECGCDPALSDALGRVPYQLADDKEGRNAFRRFMGEHPERYDYAAAQVPSALTDDVERRKQQRLAEKRKLQKQARKEKKKHEKVRLEEEQRLERARLEEEQRLEAERQRVDDEKRRFLQLSDREKRALAAERRLMSNAAGAGVATPVLARCFLCAADMTGQVPFQYQDYRFCSTTCLQKHRKAAAAGRRF